MLYMVTFTINIPQMLAYIYIYHTWFLWDIHIIYIIYIYMAYGLRVALNFKPLAMC